MADGSLPPSVPDFGGQERLTAEFSFSMQQVKLEGRKLVCFLEQILCSYASQKSNREP